MSIREVIEVVSKEIKSGTLFLPQETFDRLWGELLLIQRYGVGSSPNSIPLYRPEILYKGITIQVDTKLSFLEDFYRENHDKIKRSK